MKLLILISIRAVLHTFVLLLVNHFIDWIFSFQFSQSPSLVRDRYGKHAICYACEC